MLRYCHLSRRAVWVPVTGPSPDIEDLWRAFREPLLGFISRRITDRGDAEDILQEVMLRVHRARSDLANLDSVSAWVHRITANAITDYYRRPARREIPTGVDADRFDTHDGGDPDEAQTREEIAQCLRPMVARLSATHQQAITLTEFRGVTQVQAARELGLSVSAMKSRVQRARVELERLLRDCCDFEQGARGDLTAFHPRPGRGDCDACR